MYLWKGQWNYASTAGFFKMVCIEDITYVSVERPVELCLYWGKSTNWYV